MPEIKYLIQEEAQRFFAKIQDKRERGRLWITRVKGGVPSEFALFRDTLRILKLYLQQQDGDLHLALFLSRNKNSISRRIDSLFKRYTEKAKLPTEKHHAHTLRHSIAVHMLDTGHTQEEM